jgi:hypothetical protein
MKSILGKFLIKENTVLIILLILILTYFFTKFLIIENFTDYNTPHNVLLSGWYKPTKHPRTDIPESVQWKRFPIFPSNYLKNNNIRQWNHPSIGSCVPASVCGDLYRSLPKQPEKKACNPGYTPERVNYYNSIPFEE